MSNYKKIILALLCGLLGCVCFGVGDWLMLYGDTAYSGTISWLTTGAAQIAPWRNNLAMALAFPGNYSVRDCTVCDWDADQRRAAPEGLSLFDRGEIEQAIIEIAVNNGRRKEH